MYNKEEIKKRLQDGEIQIMLDIKSDESIKLMGYLFGTKLSEFKWLYYSMPKGSIYASASDELLRKLPIVKISHLTKDNTNSIEITAEEVLNTPEHYDNSKGTLYKIGLERNWNPYLFDIVKCLERSEKKGEFKTDLEKSINVIKLWLNESEIK
jgi:hypothetical protein